MMARALFQHVQYPIKLLLMCLSHFKAMWWSKPPFSLLQDFTRSQDKTSYWIWKQGPGSGIINLVWQSEVEVLLLNVIWSNLHHSSHNKWFKMIMANMKKIITVLFFLSRWVTSLYLKQIEFLFTEVSSKFVFSWRCISGEAKCGFPSCINIIRYIMILLVWFFS